MRKGSCSLCLRLWSPSCGNFCNIICSFLCSTIKMIITVWSPLTVLHKLGRSSSNFKVFLVQSWLHLVATSFRCPAKFTVCLEPRLTSLSHRVKFKSFPRESTQSVVLKQILSSRKLSKGRASEIFGKLGFSAGQLFSRFGRLYLVPFKLRQYGKNGCSHITKEIERAITLSLSVLPCVPFRAIPPHSGTPYVITMSDGEGTGSFAAAIWSTFALGGVHQHRWFQIDLPPSVLGAWSTSTEIELQRHINKIEVVVPAICLCTWPELIRGSLWLHFIDNDGALACFISGCSKNSSLSAVVDFTWAQIPIQRCWSWFERVPSECNIVDGLSRRNFSAAQDNNWVRDSAQLPEPLF